MVSEKQQRNNPQDSMYKHTDVILRDVGGEERNKGVYGWSENERGLSSKVLMKRKKRERERERERERKRERERERERQRIKISTL